MLKRTIFALTLICIGMTVPQFAQEEQYPYDSQSNQSGKQYQNDQNYQYDQQYQYGSQSGQQQQPASQIQWYDNYNQAAQAAQKQNKPILLFFTGSDWCGWCKKMDQEVFKTSEFAREAGNDFIFVDVDFPMNKKLSQDISQQNAMLKQKYGVTGYPTIVILDSNGNFIAETGYRPGGGKSYADYLKQLVR